MTETTFYIGSDVSKGYADFAFFDREGRSAHPDKTLDDTPRGHEQFLEILQDLREESPEATFLIGVESTGGLERNWLELFSGIDWIDQENVYQINPNLICRFKKTDLHSVSTDPISARAIADYLRAGLRVEDEPFDPKEEGLRTRARLLLKKIDHKQELKNVFQKVLMQVHPQLVSAARGDIPLWLFRVTSRYPTASHLAQADPNDLADIPYVTHSKGRKLVEEAESSVAGRTDPATAASMRELAEDLLGLCEKIKKRKKEIHRQLEGDPGLEMMKTIPGIAEWSAAVLRLEIGPIHRFPTPEKLVAFSGLDPLYDQSGDDTDQEGISKQGSTRIRRILYPCVQNAVQKNPPIKNFYDRLHGKGKEHLVAMTACMRKLLCIVYACWVKQEAFDPTYEERLKKEIEEKRKESSEGEGQQGEKKEQVEQIDLSAPVSRKEAKKRKERKEQQEQKKEAQPQESVSSRMRGQRASEEGG